MVCIDVSLRGHPRSYALDQHDKTRVLILCPIAPKAKGWQDAGFLRGCVALVCCLCGAANKRLCMANQWVMSFEFPDPHLRHQKVPS
jgi:hypothetical protein